LQSPRTVQRFSNSAIDDSNTTLLKYLIAS